MCWCVPVFVMISGVLLLNPQRLQSAGVFYRKRMSRILIPLAFWTAFYLGLRLCFEGLSWPEAGRDIVRASPYGHLWFLYMIAGLYFLTPILQPYVRLTALREQAVIVTLLLLGASAHDLISVFTGGHGKPTMFSLFLTYVPYYLCGYVLYRADLSTRWIQYCALGALVGWLGIALGTGLLYPRISLYLYGWHTPPTVLLSIGLFAAACHLFRRTASVLERRGSLIRYLDSVSLGIYLIHPLFIFALKAVGHYGEHIAQWPALSIPMMSLLLITASALMTSLLKAIPVVRRIV
jgi:surface polysaccharide O-acyltransferase-like enzyme